MPSRYIVFYLIHLHKMKTVKGLIRTATAGEAGDPFHQTVILDSDTLRTEKKEIDDQQFSKKQKLIKFVSDAYEIDKSDVVFTGAVDRGFKIKEK